MLARIGKQVESRPRVQIDGTWHQVCVLSFSRGQLLVLSVIQVVSFESAFLCIDERRDMRTSARHLIAAFARTESKVLIESFLTRETSFWLYSPNSFARFKVASLRRSLAEPQ